MKLSPRQSRYAWALVLPLLLACENNGREADADTHAGVPAADYWLTTGDKASLLAKGASPLPFGEATSGGTVIEVDSSQQFQTVDGFGYALTGGSAYLINQKLSAVQRRALLRELFTTADNGIGVNYLRVSLGASDLDAHVFSYNDLPKGKTDKAVAGFSLAEDEKNLIPVLKEILALAPDIQIMASPWSAPAWMKTNNSPKGGSLQPAYYSAYATYFVKYIEGMAAHDIKIDAVTLQNEPENPKNNPSMLMTAAEQALFVKKHLGPAFEKAGINTKIVVFDHNCDHPDYPIEILNDAAAKKYIDGSAFHLYLGDIEAMSQVHDAHPDRNVYFTEQWTSPEGTFDGDLRWHTRELIVGATRNWGRTVLEWNLAADPQFDPHTDDGGCTQCLGALTIADGGIVTRNVSYYIIAHASKFVPSGSTRIASTVSNGLHNVAFLTPAGKKVLIVVNDNNGETAFGIQFNGKRANAALPGGAVATYVW